MEQAAALYYMSVNNYFLHVNHFKNLEEPVNKAKKRRVWMSPELKNRTPQGMENVLSDLTVGSGLGFQSFLGMSSSDFETLLQMVAPFITKRDTTFRKAIPAKIRLALTLRYFASGEKISNLCKMFSVSKQMISDILNEVCQVLRAVLKEIKVPASEGEWLQKEAKFQKIFPHCLGSIDAKLIISAAHDTRVDRYEEDDPLSAVVTVLVDRNYRFVYAHIDCEQRVTERGLEYQESIIDKLDRNGLNLPEPSPLPGTENELPYVFVGDNAFPLHKNIMKPYTDKQKCNVKEKFNKHLSRARLVSENAFGVMCSVFRILRKPLTHQPDRAANIVMSCILLHNFLINRKTSRDYYMPPGYVDTILDDGVIAGAWRNNKIEQRALMSFSVVSKKNEAYSVWVRDQLAQYFSRYRNNMKGVEY